MSGGPIGIGGKLRWLAVFNAAAFALIATIAGVTFNRVEGLSSDIARQEMVGVIANASIGRDLSTMFSEIDLVSRGCHGDDSALVDAGRRLSAAMVDIVQKVKDDELATATVALSASTGQLLGECARINKTLTRVQGIDRQFQAELNKLENHIGRALIDQTLAGKATDHLDQIMTLVTGYRETMLLIAKQLAEQSADHAVQKMGGGGLIALVDDLNLRLQTLTASVPEVARIGKRLIRLVTAYREEVLRFDAGTSLFNEVLAKSHQAKESVLRSMTRLDKISASRVEGGSEEIRKIVEASSRQVLWLSGLVALLSLLAITWIIRRSINEPLRQVVEQIAAIRGGTGDSVVVSRRRDEWGAIQGALSEMSVALLRSQGLLKVIVDTVPMRVFWKDRDLRYLGCNPAFARDAGKMRPSEVIGLDDYQMGWTAQADRYRADDRAVMESGTARLFYEEPQTTPDGRTIWLSTSKVPLKSQDGTIIGVLGAYQDITERKHIEAELEQHRSHLENLVQQRTAELVRTEARASHILHSSADGLYGVDADGRITFINPAACELLGYLPEQVIGKSAHDLFHHSKADGSPYPVAECPSHHARGQGETIRIDNEVYWHADGHPVPVMYAIHPMRQNDAIAGAVISFVDMSAQRAAAEARERALIAAENLARARSEFLANMSHEIRTPLNGVLGFAQIGYRNHQDSEKARGAFEKILASGKRLLGVINDVLDFSKIEAGHMGIEAIDISLGEVLDRAVELVADRARAKGLELRLDRAADLPDRCVSDPLRLGQILLNLLSNAVKFTETGGIVLAVARQGDRLVFRVTDTGIGIDRAQLDDLFNPFQQADGSITRRFGGTGLGLAISKRILELMGGDILVHSQPGVGSTFEFRLPYVAPGAARQPEFLPRVRSDQPLAGLSILVAEDDPMNQMVLEDNLVEDGARVVLVGDGQAAVERIVADGRSAYDIVLMDIQMPEMDGYEATRRILALAPGLPIIGQTAHAFREERDKCLAAGMVGHLAKPVVPDLLVATILQHVGKNHGG
jgi:PAS domain S-box-containing protein